MDTQVLRSQVRGSVLMPGAAGYDKASLTWETIIFRQRPAIIVIPLDAADVRAAVLFANAYQLPVAVQGGGHGHAFAAETLEQEHALLLNFASMKGIEIDPQRAIARIEPGVTWSEVIPLAHKHGMAPLNGFASGVGAVGYLLGGGFGWLVRQYGLGAASLREVRFNLYVLATAPTAELLEVGARSVTQIMQAATSVASPAVLLNALAFND
jgi:FAD/FMN-containing dehydrogenase